MKQITGTIAWIFGDFFDIDLICGVDMAAVTNPETLLKVAMKDYDSDFVTRVKPGQILVAGRAFGYGHPHPQGMIVMRALGITAVVAKSYARVFFKNEVGSGMTLLPCSQLPDNLEQDEELTIDLDGWMLTRTCTGEAFPLDEIPGIERDVIRCGGIANYLKQQGTPSKS